MSLLEMLNVGAWALALVQSLLGWRDNRRLRAELERERYARRKAERQLFERECPHLFLGPNGGAS